MDMNLNEIVLLLISHPTQSDLRGEPQCFSVNDNRNQTVTETDILI
jgi:hypothetical protein